MRIPALIITAVLFISQLALAVATVDSQAPLFSATDSNGNPVNLKDFSGKTVIMEWTNHECPFVKKHYGSGNMQKLQKQYTDKDTVWLSVISSAKGKQGYVSGKEANALTKQRDAHPSYVLLDESGEIGKLYAAKTTPHMYVIDPEGMLRYMGAIDSIRSADPADIPKATNYLTQALGEIRSGKPVSEKSTKAYGCSVKY